jgi:hypothetical protein
MDNTILTFESVEEYTKWLGLTCTKEDCQAIVDYSNEFEIADTKTAVWEFLDQFEGICHSRDPEFFKGEEL